MKRLIFILLIFITYALKSNAQEDSFPRFTFGAEWGYVSSIHSIWHNNFFSPEGYRVDEKGSRAMFHSNGEASVNAGLNLNRHWNLSFHLGLTGLGELHNAVPVSFRSTYYYGDDPLADRWFTFMEAGSGISLKLPVQEIFGCKAGGGYRISLSRHTKMDFLVAVKVNYTHPDIVYDNVRIDHERINRNGMTITAIMLGMAVNL
ncbi:MAG: hypothetical protein IKY95_04460 [Bacteroidales bacterium]|nr:hypothetical protein [Bacteroidales bacterium]